MIDINNPANYKNCIKKQADYWLCKPPKGTIIVNKLEQYELLVYLRQYIPAFSSRCYLTAEEAHAIMNSNGQLYNYLLKNCYVINDTANMVLCGTEGEMWVTNWDYVCNNYLIYSQNGFVSIPSVINSKIIEYNGEKLLDWCRVTVKATGERKFACFVPVNQKGGIPTSKGIMLKYNTAGVEHGKGDFIVCDSVNGKPNLQSRWVVNGLVFSNTYDNRGWSDKVIVGRMGISEPQKLWVEEVEKKSEDNSDDLKEYLLNWFTKNNIQNACDFINNKNPTKYILEGFRTMTIIANHLMSNHGFTKFESNEEEISFDNISYFSIYNGVPDGICLNIYYANNLCGWNYSDENGEFYEEPYEVECKSKKDIDDFINMLDTGISTFRLLQKLFESISGADSLLKDLNSLSSDAVDNLNKVSFNYRVLSVFVKLMLKACKQFKVNEISFDYNLESSLRFDITIDGNLGTFDLDIETNAISAFFYYNDTDFFETTVAYNDYDAVVDFFNRVKTNDNSLSYNLSVKFLDMPKSIVAFNVLKAYFSYDNKKYSSKLGDFLVILKQICQQLDAEVNFTSLIDIEAVDYSDVTELPSSDFINKFFSTLDNAIRVCIYNKSTDFIRTSDLSIATFVVLNYTRVKRVYGKVVYSNGIELFVNISKSTLELLKYEHPELVSESLGG